ncbi:MAG: hypothetical protein PWQ85_862 [Geotoga sp.]|jgi:hypothetical protein|nr:hypothetical protein [Geotoga sp.]
MGLTISIRIYIYYNINLYSDKNRNIQIIIRHITFKITIKA